MSVHVMFSVLSTLSVGMVMYLQTVEDVQVIKRAIVKKDTLLGCYPKGQFCPGIPIHNYGPTLLYMYHRVPCIS